MDASGNSSDKIEPKRASLGSLDIVILVIIAIQIIVAVYGIIVLPDKVPIHWGVNTKWVETILFPIISVVLYSVIRAFIAVGPRLGGSEATATNLQVGRMIIVGITLLMLIIQLVLIAGSLGIAFNIMMVISLAVSLLLIFIGNFMGRIRRNFGMGVRTPWTLTNATVWERTHRLGGWMYVAVGLIGIPFSFIPALRLWGGVVLMIAVTIFLVVYSYFCFQQVTREGHEVLSPPFDEHN